MNPQKPNLISLADHGLLVPPGEGVVAINTAHARRHALQAAYYGTTDPTAVHQAWRQSLDRLSTASFGILGIPSDAGGGILRGANWGPLAIRSACEQKGNGVDIGDVRVIPQLLRDEDLNDFFLKKLKALHHGDPNSAYPVSPLSAAQFIGDVLYAAYPDLRLFSLGGDHSVSFPAIQSFLNAKGAGDVGVLHFDAHTDLLPHRLGVEISFASWARGLIPQLKRADAWVQVGIRATNRNQADWEKETGVKQFWAARFSPDNHLAIAQDILDHYHALGIQKLYVTVDIDVLDVRFAAATGTPEKDGLSPQQVVEMIRFLKKQLTILSGDLVEVAPFSLGDLTYRDQEPDTTIESAASIFQTLVAD